MPVGIAVREAGKARSSANLPVHCEDEGELIHRSGKTRVPERARKLEGSECYGASVLDLIVEEQKGGQVVGPGAQTAGCHAEGAVAWHPPAAM
jgi:hypothetical protein